MQQHSYSADVKKILLVENDRNDALLYQQYLTGSGYDADNIIWRRTLTEALLQQPAALSLIITDLALPDSPAADTFNRIQQRFSHLPVIVVSGLPEEEFALITIQAGAQDYIAKSDLDTKTFLKAIRYAIERKRSNHEEQQQDGQQLRAAINNTSDLIWSVDADRNIIIANDAFWNWMYQKTGTRTRVFGESFLNEEAVIWWQDHFGKAFTGEAFTVMRKRSTKNGIHYEEVSFNPIRNENNMVTGVSCVSRDVTKQQLHIEKIQLQNEYLEKISWIHSHEARAPVANILGLAHLLNISEPDDPDNQMMLELIVESADQLDKTIRRIAADIDNYQLYYGGDEE